MTTRPTPPAVSAPVTLRAAVAADAAPFASFAREVFIATYGPTSRPEDVDAYVRRHFGADVQRAELADPRMTTLLAERADDGRVRIVGYVQLRRDAPWPDDARWLDGAPPPGGVEIARLYADHAWHGHGVGAALLDAACAHAAAGGAAYVWLCAWQHNARAAAFYRKHGFTVVGTSTFGMGDEVQDDWIMRRPLASPASA